MDAVEDEAVEEEEELEDAYCVYESVRDLLSCYFYVVVH
jgi:hypothetical protein